MRGTKRAALSDSSPAAAPNDSVFQYKRVTAGSRFDAQRAEPLQQQTTTTSLDMQRAESAQKHVRALNNQFASWVQTQLKNHPDELWEDGLRDYLAHASNILEKFSDVVNWLKENAAKGDNSTVESHGTEKKLVTENKSNEVKLFQEKNAYSSENSTTSLAFSWSRPAPSSSQSGLFSSNQSGLFSSSPSSQSGFSSNSQSEVFSFGLKSSSQPGLFSNSQSGLTSSSQPGLFSNIHSGLTSNSQPGLFSNSQSGLTSNSKPLFSFSNNQTPALSVSVPAKQDGADDADEDEPTQPSSPSVKKSEEKGILVVHEVKCKLYVKSNDPADKDTWKDKGTGQLNIKCIEGCEKGTKESKPIILVRNDVGKVLLNALLYPGIKTNSQKNSIVAIFHTTDDTDNEKVVPRTFLIRTKTAEERDKLANAIQEYAPSS